MARLRQLVVVADDFGIGPETDRGILELGAAGRVTSTVMLVNSRHAEAAIVAWNHAGRPIELGWHPALTLDRPILAANRVPSLVDSAGAFHPLGTFLRKAMLGRIRGTEVFAELTAQFERFVDLAGQPPRLVNSHQHLSLFRPVRAALHELLKGLPQRPFVRRVREPWRTLARVPGARIKRVMLNRLGRNQARDLQRDGFPGCDWLAGITDPPCVADPRFFHRWLANIPGRTVELMCHPGHRDATLIGRDTPANTIEISLLRRVRELDMLQRPEFLDTVRQAGFELVPASRIVKSLALAA